MKTLRKLYGDATGPLGFPMRSDVARAVEAARKEQSADMRQAFSTDVNGQTVDGYCRIAKAPSAINIDDDARTDVSLVTTASVDRDHEVVLPKGIDWSQFRRNMVVPFAHTYDALPVGRGLWITRQKSDNPKKDGWAAKTQYTRKPPEWGGDWFADAVFWMIQEKVLLGKSIGFMPLTGSPPTEDDLRRRPEFAGVRWIVEKALILEYSVVPVPSNPDALVTQVGKCAAAGHRWPDAVLNQLGVIVPDSVPTIENYLADDIDDTKQTNAPELPKLQGRCRTMAEYRKEFSRRLHASFNGIDLEAVSVEITDAARGKL